MARSSFEFYTRSNLCYFAITIWFELMHLPNPTNAIKKWTEDLSRCFSQEDTQMANTMRKDAALH